MKNSQMMLRQLVILHSHPIQSTSENHCMHWYSYHNADQPTIIPIVPEQKMIKFDLKSVLSPA